MATQKLPIINQNTLPDSGIYPAKISDMLTLTSAVGNESCIVMSEVATDSGISGSFVVPDDYVGAPVIRAKGIIDGTVTGTLAFGFSLLGRADSEAYDTAFEAADLADNGGVWTGYADEDVYEETISLTVTLSAGDIVPFHFFIDDSVNTFAGNFLLQSLIFQYSDV